MKPTPLYLLVSLFCAVTSLVQAQKPIVITEQDVDIDPKTVEVLVYDFVEGDKILLDVAEEDGKPLGEMAFIASPGAVRWRELETAAVEQQTFTVSQSGHHMFRFVHDRGGHRHLHVRIVRVPRGILTADHETAVNVEIEADSVFARVEQEVVVGYDSVPVESTERINTRTEYREEVLLVRSERLTAGESRMVSFNLPHDLETRARDEKVAAWAYWIGVGEESSLAWEQNKDLIRKTVKVASSLTLTPLGALAAGLATDLLLPPKGMGEDVLFKIAQNDPRAPKGFNAVDQGAGVAGYRKISDPALLQGEFGFFIENDNRLTAIDVELRVSAYVEIKYWREEYGMHLERQPRLEMQTVRKFVGLLYE